TRTPTGHSVWASGRISTPPPTTALAELPPEAEHPARRVHVDQNLTRKMTRPADGTRLDRAPPARDKRETGEHRLASKTRRRDAKPVLFPGRPAAVRISTRGD